MRDRNRAVQQAVPTPVTTVNNADEDTDMLPISDDDSVDSSLCSRDSESEGGIWDNQYNDDISIAPEGAQLIPPDYDSNRAPLVGSPVGSNIDPEHEAAHPAPNIVPAPTQAPERATRQRCGKQVLPAVWQRGADGKMERIAMSVVKKQYKKFNCDMFALTFGHQDPPMAQQMS
jgi:hypothetical protein